MNKKSTSWWPQFLNPFRLHGSRKRKEERQRRQRRCQVEALESRTLLSSVPSSIVGILDPAYAQTGTGWQTQVVSTSYAGQIRSHAGGDGSDTASFTLTGLSSGTSYQLFATYPASSGNADDTPFTVTDGTNVLRHIDLDQQTAPNQATFSGENWESLGTCQTSTGTFVVSLSDWATEGNVVADAVAAVPVTQSGTQSAGTQSQINPLTVTTDTWTGGGANNNWGTAGNWSGGVPVAGDALVFSGTTQTSTNNNLTAGTSFYSITITSSNFGLGGNQVTLTNGLAVNSSITGSTISLPIALSGANTFSISSPLTDSGVISGTGSLDMTGSSTLDLTGVNTFSGGATLGAGITQGNNSGSPGTGTVTMSGGTFEATASFTLGNAVSMTAEGQFLVDSTYTLNVTGAISGGQELWKGNSGTLELSGQNTYSGGTGLALGALQAGISTASNGAYGPFGWPGDPGGFVGSAGTTVNLAGHQGTVGPLMGSATFTDSSGGTLNVNQFVSTCFAGPITGNLAVSVYGGAAVALTNTSSNFSGGLTVSNSGTTVQAGADADLGSTGTSIRLTNSGGLEATASFTLLNNVSIASEGYFLVDSNYDLTVTGLVSGGEVWKGNSGRLTMSNSSNSYGSNAIAAGTLQAGATYSSGNDDCFGNIPSGFYISSGATVSLNGYNVAIGPVSGSGAMNNGATSVVSTLTVDEFAGTAFSGVFANGGAASLGLAVNGGQTLTLTAASTYTGPTSVTAGALAIGPGGSLGNTVIGVASGATFAPNPGSGTVSAGTTGAGTAGATLGLGSGAIFNMQDGSAGTFQLQQNTSFGGAALTLNGATLDFDLGSSAADQLAVTKTASVSGTNTINIKPLGSSLTAGAYYNLVTASGGLGGTFHFSNGTASENVTVGGVSYTLVLSNSATAETVTVELAPMVTTNPSNDTVNAGSQASFTAAASGYPTPTVQWELSTDGGQTFNAISGATSTTYSFTTNAGENGNEYEAVFTNPAGSATSAAALLTVPGASEYMVPSTLTDGSLVLPLDAAGLTYVSGSNAQPVVYVDANGLSYYNGSATLQSVTAQATLGGVAGSAVTYSASNFSSGTSYRFASPVNASSLATGRYDWTMTLTENYADGSHVQLPAFCGQQDVLDWNTSPCGLAPHWSFTGVDYLVPDGDGGISLVESDGTMTYFQSDGDNTYSPTSGPLVYDQIVGSWGAGFTLSGMDGTEENFNGSGLMTSTLDNDGNSTTYNWSGSELTSIVDPSHHTTSFGYTSGLLTSITDFASRVTTLAYTSGQLTSVTAPNPNNANVSGETTPVTQLAYSSGRLGSVKDPDGNETQYSYDSTAGGLAKMTNPDSSAEYYQAAQTLPLDNAATGLTATAGDTGIDTDELGNKTYYTFDNFGSPLTVTNALGQATAYQYNGAEQVTEMQQPDPATGQIDANSPTTYYGYNPDYGTLTSEQLPDGAQESWSYTLQTDAATGQPIVTPATFTQASPAAETLYSYDSTGDLLSSEQYANGTSPDNTGQNTTPGGDPITSYVYTPGGTGLPPAGLVASTTDPDGNVTAYNYDQAGNSTAVYQGQTVAMSSNSSAFSNLPQSPGVTRTYTVYVNSLPSSSDGTGDGYTVTESVPGSPTGVTLALSVSSTTPLGSGWYELGTVALSATDVNGTLAVAYGGTHSSPTAVTLLEQTSATVYNNEEDAVSATDALGNVSATSYDNLDRPVATSQGQTVAMSSNSAAFSNLPQSPGLTRTYTIYVNSQPSSSDGTGDGYTVTESVPGSPTGVSLTLNVSSTTPLGSGWYELGTVVLNASDVNSKLTVSYGGTHSTPTAVTLLEQTSATVYDAASNILSTLSPLPSGEGQGGGALGDATIYTRNYLGEQTSTSQGQVLPTGAGSTSFNNLPQTPNVLRTYTLYAYSTSTLTSGIDSSVSVSDTAGGLTLTNAFSATTPLGNNWYELGTVAVSSTDASTTLAVSYSGGLIANLCLVQPTSADGYDVDGNLASEKDGDGNQTTYTYSAVGSELSETDPTVSAGTPVTTYAWDALGRETAVFSPLPSGGSGTSGDDAVTTYAYQLGTTSTPGLTVTTSAGQAVSSSSTASFYNLSLVPGQARTYTLYAYSTSTLTSSVDSSVSVSDTAGGLTLTAAFSTTTPLGANWYELGTVTLGSGDTSSVVTASYSGTGISEVALVSQSTVDTYNANGSLTSTVDPLGNTTTYSFSPLGLPQQQVVSGHDLGPVYDKAGNTISDTDLQNGYVTEYSYDMLGDQVQTIEPSAGGTTGAGPVTTDVYDVNSDLLSEIDALGNVTTWSFDAFGNQVSQSLPNPTTGAAGGPTTTYAYDLDGDMTSLTDPAPTPNTTSWTYDAFGRETGQSETVALGYGAGGSINTTTATYSYQYDANGNLLQSVDADGRTVDSAYNALNQETGQTWYDASHTETGTVSYSYDLAGDMTAASNTTGASTSVAAYTYQYDSAGDLTAQNVQLGGLSSSDNVLLTSTYDARSERLGLAANVGGTLGTGGSVSGGTPDFLNSYTYDIVGNMTGIKQTGQTGGNTVTSKNVALGYDYDGRLTGVAAYQSAGTGSEVCSSSYTYDANSNLTALSYTGQGSTTLASYQWAYDADARVTQEKSSADATTGNAWGVTAYTFDHDSQLTGTTYTNFNNPPGSSGGSGGSGGGSISLSYDSNGNRTNVTPPPGTTTTTGAGNRLLYDGNYYYTYDADGNRTSQYQLNGSGQQINVTTYTWNDANQMTAVTTGGNTISYSYDSLGRMVSRTDSNGAKYYVYDGQNLALVLNSSGSVVERELTGPAVDQVFASENASTGVVNWLLTDNQGTVRDVAQYNATTTSVVDHLVYDPFGQITSQTNSTNQPTFTYNGQWQDPATGMILTPSGWYLPTDGVFASAAAQGNGATNPYEYSGNNPTTTDLVMGQQQINPDSAVGLLTNGSVTAPVWGYSGNELGFAGAGGNGATILVGNPTAQQQPSSGLGGTPTPFFSGDPAYTFEGIVGGTSPNPYRSHDPAVRLPPPPPPVSPALPPSGTQFKEGAIWRPWRPGMPRPIEYPPPESPPPAPAPPKRTLPPRATPPKTPPPSSQPPTPPEPSPPRKIPWRPQYKGPRPAPPEVIPEPPAPVPSPPPPPVAPAIPWWRWIFRLPLIIWPQPDQYFHPGRSYPQYGDPMWS